MANTCYACFDGDNDIHYYRLMTAWHANGRFDFTFQDAHAITQARDSSSEETIKRSLRTRLNASDVFIVLVGRTTKNLYKFVRWEIEVALEKGIPIIVANLDGERKMNYNLCPPILRNELVVHVPFSPAILNYAIRNWPADHQSLTNKGVYGERVYGTGVYNQLGY